MKAKIGIFKPLIFILFALAAIGAFALIPAQGAALAEGEIAPFTVNIFADGNQFVRTYGATVKLNALISRALAEGETASYQWYRVIETDYMPLWGETTYTISFTEVAETGEYMCEITISDGEFSFTASKTAQITINPRLSTVIWGESSLIYNGQPQVPTASARGVGSYYLPLEITGHETETGTGYTAYASTNDGNYTLTNASVQFEITPMELDVDWSGSPSRFIYNGQPQAPIATATGVDGPVELIILGAETNVNEGGYTATATVADPNYKLNRLSSSTRFYIDPLEVSIVWESTSLIYNGVAQYPQATATGVNGYNIPLNYFGSGTDASLSPYSTLVTTLDTNYVLINNETDFIINPMPVEIIWMLPQGGFTYNNRDQSANIMARYIKPDSTQAPLIVTVNDDKIFRNAGEYTVTAEMPDSVTNFRIGDDQERTITLTIRKAKPLINVEDLYPVFTYNGGYFSIAAEMTNGETPIFAVNGQRVENNFREAGKYTVVVMSNETENYLPADEVVVYLTIMETRFETPADGKFRGRITLTEGQDPDATVEIIEISKNQMTGYTDQWARSVNGAFTVRFKSGEQSYDLDCPAKLTFKLPDRFASSETLRVIAYQNGAYREQIVENKGGYITVNLYENGIYAITEVDGTLLMVWWGAVCGIVVIVVIAMCAYFVRKSRRIG